MKRHPPFAIRIAFLLLAAALVWIVSNPLARRNILRQCAAVTGAPVEASSIRSSLYSRNVQLTNLRVADPNDLARNLLEADAASLTFDRARLWHREFVIEHGKLENIRFGKPRVANDTSTPPNSISSKRSIHWDAQQWTTELRKRKEQFCDQLQIPAFDPSNDSPELARTLKNLKTTLPQLIEQVRVNALATKDRLSKVQALVHQPGRNPLRDAERAPALLASLQVVQTDWNKSSQELNDLRNAIDKARQDLAKARDIDAQAIRVQDTTASIEEGSLSQILVSNFQTARVNEILDWLRWFRQAVPSVDGDLRPTRGPGVNVRFLRANRPDFLIRSLDFDGTSVFFGQQLEFSGRAKNISLQPSLLSEPSSIELHSHESNPIRITAEMDRRTKEKIDRIKFDCPLIHLPGQSLGYDDSISLDVSPTKSSVTAEFRICGDSLDGTITLLQSDAAMRMREISANLGGADLSAALNRELTTLNQITTEVHLSGKLSDIQVELTSDLGPRLGGTIANFAEKRAKSAIQDNLKQLHQFFETESVKLIDEWQSRMAEIDELLQADQTRIAELNQRVPSNDGLNRIR